MTPTHEVLVRGGPLVEWFMGHVQPEPNSGCWLWAGHDNGRGYGYINMRGKRCRAHRVAYELFRGPIPDGLQLDHLCRVRCCVNPDHLEAVTARENTIRGKIVSDPPTRSPIVRAFGPAMRRAREEQGMRVVAVARAAGITHGGLRRIELGASRATPGLALRLAGVLGISADVVLSYSRAHGTCHSDALPSAGQRNLPTHTQT